MLRAAMKVWVDVGSHNWRFTEEPHFEEPHVLFMLLEGSDLDAQEGTHVQKMYFSQTERR